MKIRIFVTTRFEGFHRWEDAPEEVAFLRSLHRHIFHVRAEKEVAHDDRQIEFILLKRRIDADIAQIQSSPQKSHETWSCEQWARYLIAREFLSKCEVSEDGENGAVVEA